jgi:serine/threonine-protein kinase
MGFSYVYARRYDQARFHMDRAITMNPNSEESYRILGLALSLEGEHEEAERILRDTVAMPDAGSYSHATLGYALARAGKVAEAREILKRLEVERTAGYVSPVAFATILLGLGDVDRALDWAEASYEDRRGWLVYLKVNPIMDPMRGHPRFDALVKKMRL